MKNKTKKFVLLGIIGLLIIVGAVMLISTSGDSENITKSDSTTYSASALTSTETKFDFNTISMEEGIVSHDFTVTNNGTEPVEIGKVYTSCACTTAYIIDKSGEKYGKFGMPGHRDLLATADVVVQPGESVKIEAIFDPAFHGPSGVGLVDRSIYLETNSANSPKLELRLRATVVK